MSLFCLKYISGLQRLHFHKIHTKHNGFLGGKKGYWLSWWTTPQNVFEKLYSINPVTFILQHSLSNSFLTFTQSFFYITVQVACSESWWFVWNMLKNTNWLNWPETSWLECTPSDNWIIMIMIVVSKKKLNVLGFSK